LLLPLLLLNSEHQRINHMLHHAMSVTLLLLLVSSAVVRLRNTSMT